MRCIEITTPGGPEVLKLAERPRPTIKPDEVLIQVEAAGVIRMDVLQRQGRYPPPLGYSDVPGLEVAGTVSEVGELVSSVCPGDRVCALVGGGGYAEYCVAPVLQILPIPEGWSATEAAALPENMFTVYDMLVRRLQLSMGETILIHGGSSGIGSTAIMLARALAAIPITTAGTDEKCAACLAIGAEHAINYKTMDFVHEAKLFTDGRGVDTILDIVGGDYLARDLDAIAVEGRIGVLAAQRGSLPELSLIALMQKRAMIRGAVMRSRSVAEKAKVAEDLRKHIWPLLPHRLHIRPLIDSVFPIADAAMAHRKLEQGSYVGKIVLTLV